jgi:hypothetical protein
MLCLLRRHWWVRWLAKVCFSSVIATKTLNKTKSTGKTRLKKRPTQSWKNYLPFSTPVVYIAKRFWLFEVKKEKV